MATFEKRPSRLRRGNPPAEKPSIEARLLAAMERLLDKGQRFGNVSVEQLAKEAGIARGTFYVHFRDKGELVARLMSLVTDEIVESTGTWLANTQGERAEIEQALVGMVDTFKKHQAILSAVSEVAPFDEKVAELYRSMVGTICAQSRRSLATVRRKGLSRPGASDDVAEVMSWMIVMYCARFIGERSGKSLRKLQKTLGYIAASTALAD